MLAHFARVGVGCVASGNSQESLNVTTPRKAVLMSDHPKEATQDDETDKAGSTSQEFGNLSIEDDAEGTVDPAELAGTGGADDDGGPETP